MGWGKGSDRNFKASQTERYRKTKKDRRERRETSGGDPKIRVRGRGSSTCAPGAGPRIALAKNLRGQGSRLSTGQAEGCPHAPEEAAPPPTVGLRVIIDDLVPIPVVTLSLVVGKKIQQANYSRGDRRYPRGTPMETPGTDWATSAVIVPRASPFSVHKN